jgi:hypothetical protein
MSFGNAVNQQFNPLLKRTAKQYPPAETICCNSLFKTQEGTTTRDTYRKTNRKQRKKE